MNNLLSVPIGWNPIVSERRDSAPSDPQMSSTSDTVAESSSALQTLVANLRNEQGTKGMIQIASGQDDAELLKELRTRINAISSSLEPAHALLANSLVSLLSHLQRLSTIQSSSTKSLSKAASPSYTDVAGPSDPFSLLRRHLSDLQIERLSSQPDILAPDAPPVLVVEAALLWNKVDEELESVLTMCKDHAEYMSLQQPDVISLPPDYDFEDGYDDYQSDILPEYDEAGVRTSLESKSRHPLLSPATSSRQVDEKMRLDLEGVTMAIDRLYLVAPQLHNQRVELKTTKLAQMEKARKDGMHSPKAGKQMENDTQDLERMLDLLGKASERTLPNQSVVLEEGLHARLEKARQKELARKQAFVEQLAKHSSAGRLHTQDAVMQPRVKDPHALLTLPEFIREAVPASVIRADPKALLTLPEFVKESPPSRLLDKDSDVQVTPFYQDNKDSRYRSLSAPPLSWLRSSSSKSSSANSSSELSQSRPSSASSVEFEVHYVAENHENLQHVIVFFTVTGATPGVDIEAEVLPPFPEKYSEGGDHLIIRSGSRNSLPLLLPARILPGKQEVRVQSTHYEIKLTTIGPRFSADVPVEDPPPLLDATQLSAAMPSSFICASCSLNLVQATKINEYRDLPSEHWQELVEAWMCHSDQKLHDQVVKHGKTGFWPEPEQALVGGSYILFEESAMARHNLHLAAAAKEHFMGATIESTFLPGFHICFARFVPKLSLQAGEDWRLARCLCGAVLGRYQDHRKGDESCNVFRLLKFAIRPVSFNIESVCHTFPLTGMLKNLV
ncbi:hypothetical protein C0992_006951 [Termitomyces sp. T32_za158]|nr:hypothetical protein C0992_006951 [Termitomyces sp. T32_za158]